MTRSASLLVAFSTLASSSSWASAYQYDIAGQCRFIQPAGDTQVFQTTPPIAAGRAVRSVW